MAAGLPIVVSRVGQLDELIRNEVTGLVIPPDDAIALAQALSRLFLDPSLRVRLGQSARKAVLEGHTWNGIAQSILRIAGTDPVKQSSVLR